MPRALIDGNLESLRFMWIPGWRLHTLGAWLSAFAFSKEWWRARPWIPRKKDPRFGPNIDEVLAPGRHGTMP